MTTTTKAATVCAILAAVNMIAEAPLAAALFTAAVLGYLFATLTAKIKDKPMPRPQTRPANHRNGAHRQTPAARRTAR